MTPVVTDARLAEVIDFHERLRCMQAERHQLKEACMADDVVQALTHYRQLRHQQRAAEWRPIETAPKDGTSVMLFPHYVVTHWEVDKGGFVDWSEGQDDYVLYRIDFTHWMPLSSPPDAAIDAAMAK